MIEDLKQVRDALAAYNTSSTVKHPLIREHGIRALATLDRIIADHIPDDSKMVVPEGWKLVPIELSEENYLYSHHMVHAGWNAWEDANEKGLLVSTMLMNIYKAMISVIGEKNA